MWDKLLVWLVILETSLETGTLNNLNMRSERGFNITGWISLHNRGRQDCKLRDESPW